MILYEVCGGGGYLTTTFRLEYDMSAFLNIIIPLCDSFFLKKNSLQTALDMFSGLIRLGEKLNSQRLRRVVARDCPLSA